MKPNEVVLQFIEAINTQDVELLLELMTPDHTFIDTDGTETRGREAMREPWAGYFRKVPDYAITADDILASGGTVVVVGLATGTCAKDGSLSQENRFETPAAWRAVVKGGHVAEWQIFADNQRVRDILARVTHE